MYIETKKNFVSDLRKDNPVTLQLFTDTIERIIKKFPE